ncbi:MAG: phosphatase PAP2 family protein [Candidatus Marinimicrobia bacterium]|nr:phosphatase PAP2 family protein [Candidatus Neomarinimicrobiota bacterium]
MEGKLINNLYRSLIITLLFITSIVHANERKYSTKGEILEWSIIATAYLATLTLDNMPVWPSEPLMGGSTNKSYFQSSVPTSRIYEGIGVVGAAIALVPNNSGWMNQISYRNLKGFFEATSFASLVTNLAKNIVGRKRPSFDKYPKDEEIDSKKSFFSGHASSSFSIATYSSLFVFEHIGNKKNPLHLAGKIFFSASMISLASITSYSRVEDNKHFISDIIVGGIVGTTISTFVYVYQNDKWVFKRVEGQTISNFDMDVSFHKGIYQISLSTTF